jgi:hypothetical protein
LLYLFFVFIADYPIVITPGLIQDLYILKKGYVRVTHSPFEAANSQIDVPQTNSHQLNFEPLPCNYFPKAHTSIADLKNVETPVSNTSLLWLSQNITEWKFMGRYLGLSEYEITRIRQEQPHDISEQVIQMLFTWKKLNKPGEITYQKLLDALDFAEKCSNLHNDFIRFVKEQHQNEVLSK